MTEEVANQLDLPTDFGDWEAEYRALVDSCALIGRVDRGAVFLTGDKPAEMLNGLVTNEVAATGGNGRTTSALVIDYSGSTRTARGM